MKYFDAVISSKPELYFPLTSNLYNYGSVDADISAAATPVFTHFPMTSYSTKSLLVDGNTLSLSDAIPAFPHKVWKKSLVVECMLFPTGDFTILETEDSYYDDESNTFFNVQNTIKISYESSQVKVKVHDNLFVSRPLTERNLHHLVVVINSGQVLVYNNGAIILSDSYDDFDLYNYSVSYIRTHGDGYLSHLAIYFSKQNILDLVSHWAYIAPDISKVKTFSTDPTSLCYTFDWSSIRGSSVFESPSRSQPNFEWRYSGSENVIIDDGASSVVASSNFSPVIIDGGQDSLPYFYSGVILNNFGRFLDEGKLVVLEFNDYSINEFDKTIIKVASSDAALDVSEINEVVVLSYSSQEFSVMHEFSETPDINYRFELEFDNDSELTVRLISDEIELGSYTLTNISNSFSSSTVSIFSDLDNSMKFYGAELVELSVTNIESQQVLIDVDPSTLNVVNSGNVQVSMKRLPESGDSKVFWSPINSTVSSPGLSYGDSITEKSFTLNIDGASDVLSPELYSTYVFHYDNKEVVPLIGSESMIIEGDFIPPIAQGTANLSYSQYASFKLNSGRLRIKPSESDQNYVEDWSCVNPSYWTFTGCSGQILYDSTLTSGSGILVQYENSSHKVKSNKVFIQSGEDYDLSAIIKMLGGSNDLSLYVEWYTTQDQLISESSKVNASFNRVINAPTIIVTAPATASYAKVCISSASDSGSYILDDVYFGKNFSGIYSEKHTQFNNFSIMFRSETDSLDIFYHNFDKEYSLMITSGVLSFTGFDSVELNGQPISSGHTVENLEGWNHILASVGETGIIQVSNDSPIYIGGRSSASGDFYIGAVAFGMNSFDYHYHQFFGVTDSEVITDSNSASAVLQNDGIVSVSNPWVRV